MTPMKRGLGILLVLILFPIAFAAHTATISTDYVPVYETNPVNITIDVENDFASTATINTVNFVPSGFNIGSLIVPVDWSLINNDSINLFTDVAGISNWGSQKFGISAVAEKVDDDTSFTWTFTTTDRNLESDTHQVTFNVLNDNTPPVLSNFQPGRFTTGGNSTPFSLNAQDPETGIDNAQLYLSNCDEIFDNATNQSAVEYDTIDVSCTNSGNGANELCSANQDLSSWPEGDACFYFDVYNKGGEKATSGDLTTIIDRTPPNVSLISPDNNIFINTSSVDLQFRAKDNYATQLNCSVVVNGNSNDMSTSQEDNSYTLSSAVDGAYAWHASCTDEAGLTASSEERTFSIDTQAPTINISVPAVNDRGTPVAIDAQIEDLGSGVNDSSVSAEIISPDGNSTQVSVSNGMISYATTTSTVPGNYTVTITASDNLGQTSTQSAEFRIRETYSITLNVVPRIDASTENNTIYTNVTGTVIKDDGTIPEGTIELIEISADENLSIDNLTGAFQTQMQIPEINGVYNVTAIFTNGIDTFTNVAAISVGPYCGNGAIDLNEECDGTTIPKACSDYGFSQGTLSCSASCTIITSQCSNPPQQQHYAHHSSGSSGNVVIPPVQPAQTPEITVIGNPEIIQPVVQEPPAQSSIVSVEQPAQVMAGAGGNMTVDETGLGIGAAWAAFTDFTKKLNMGIITAIMVIAVLLYLLGWKGRKDEWDRYFERHGRN